MDSIATMHVYRYWGKTQDDDYHPLICHALDVAVVGLVWWDSAPAVRRAFAHAFGVDQATMAQLRAWVLFFLALHDIGKLDVRFQCKAPKVLRTLWPELDPASIVKSELIDFDHGVRGFNWAAAECFEWLGAIENGEELAGELADAWLPWLAAVTGHHGDIASKSANLFGPLDQTLAAQDRQARQELVNLLAALFLHPADLQLASPLPACHEAAQHLLAGFCAVCDWIGSNLEVMPYTAFDAALPLSAYLTGRIVKLQQEQWLRRFGLLGLVQPCQGVTALLNTAAGEQPRGLQVLVDAWRPEVGLTLIEAPTGSGKTEAALAYAWRLLESGAADSVIFALPTQATANAMLKRAEQFAAHAFAGDAANLVLAHGRSRFHSEFQRLLAQGRKPAAQGTQEASQQCALWLAQSRKRVFLGQIGICTVDQVLLSVLPVRHQFVRGFGIHKSVLIVDEVHAYDRYMHGLLAAVLKRQRAVGGSAILLSATLPSGLRNRLLSAWSATGPTKAPYPVAWRATHGLATPLTVPDQQRPALREVITELLKIPGAYPDDALVDRLIAAAAAGARIAVVVNLVDDAQRLARQLAARTSLPVDVFHARYRFMDRQIKEQAVLAHYGRERSPGGGRILVATQVVEQSLDLDFDGLVTQICPVDLLFQRLGRLHRHPRARPAGFESPRCTILSVENHDYGAHKLIYGNIRVLWRTERLLTQADRIGFPAAYRDWIEPVYQEEDWAEEPESISLDYAKFDIAQKVAELEAKQKVSLNRKPYADDDLVIAANTRDGEMSLTLLPVRADGSLLDGTDIQRLDQGQQAEALNLNTIPVPHSWQRSILSGCETDGEGRYRLSFVEQSSGVWLSQVGKHTLRYSQAFGLERDAGDLSPLS